MNLCAIRESEAPIAPLLTAEVLPVLKPHRDLAGLDDSMNGPSKGRFNRAAPPYRWMRAIIVAYLAHNPDLPQLIAEYRGQLKSKDELRERYDRIAERLTKLA